jgi:hypothetical protein
MQACLCHNISNHYEVVDLMKKLSLFSFILALTIIRACFAALAQQPAQPQQPDDVPATDAQSGPCSVELTVLGADAKPVYAARIDYHAAYGFMGAHKLDMAVYTNAQGKAKFTGVWTRVKNPPIEFHAAKDDLFGVATVDPAAECHAKHDIVMDKKK